MGRVRLWSSESESVDSRNKATKRGNPKSPGGGILFSFAPKLGSLYI